MGHNRPMVQKRDGSDAWGAIRVRGARENNLRDISIDIPKRKLTVFKIGRAHV